MPFVRYIMLLSLVVWIGGIIFFAFVLAPTVFSVLPTHQLAGNVVNRSLSILHWMGLACGVIFAATSLLESYVMDGEMHPLAARHLVVALMIVLTLFSTFVVQSHMWSLRQQMGVIDDVPQEDARRVEFNRWHLWSTRLEGTVLVLGLALLYLTSRRLAA